MPAVSAHNTPRWRPGLADAFFEPSLKCRQAHGVDHPIGGHSSLAGHLDSPVRKVDFVGGMRVRIDAHYAAEFERTSVPPPVEVEPPRICVDLHRDAMLRACSKNLFDADVVARPPEQLAPRHVAEDRHEWVCDGAQDTLGLLLLVLPELAVHAR